MMGGDSQIQCLPCPQVYVNPVTYDPPVDAYTADADTHFADEDTHTADMTI